MAHDIPPRKTYTISTSARLLRVSLRVLPCALPPVAGDDGVSSQAQYGWVSGACTAPNKDDRYIVEFVGKHEFCILAYLDRFGRVFTTNEALQAPPARKPDLRLVVSSAASSSGEVRGHLEILDEEENMREVARCSSVHDRLTLFDSWFDFGPYGADLSLDDALTRAYLAFVYRPSLGGAPVPERGLGAVHARLRFEKLPRALRGILEDVQRAEVDSYVRPPALMRALAQWVAQAGFSLEKVNALPDDAVRLVRTIRYANTFYVALENEKVGISRQMVLALESALNRFLLVEEALGEAASLAQEADCMLWDAYLIESVGLQAPRIERIESAAAGIAGGEWEISCALGAVLERLRLPARVEARMRVSVSGGVAAFEIEAPDAALMPAHLWTQDASGSQRVAASVEYRQAQALRYAMHVGLLMAKAAFEVSSRMQQVSVVAQAFSNNSDEPPVHEHLSTEQPSGEFPAEQQQVAYYKVMFGRALYENTGGFAGALAGNPYDLFAQSNALFEVAVQQPFAVVESLEQAQLRQALPETTEASLGLPAQYVLGTALAANLRISAKAYRRQVGERLADAMVTTTNTTEAIRLVREEQDAARERDDDLAQAAATRLMSALAQGVVDTKDQNAVVASFLGEDRCLAALNRAQAVAQRSPEEAVSILIDAVSEAAVLDGFVDGASTVYRSFDSYVARVLYERARSGYASTLSDEGPRDTAEPDNPGALTLEARARADVGKRVVLVPDSFYLCHLEIVGLLERSFEHADQALHYGRRAVELGPATADGYRRLGRAYMLVGDMDSARSVLESGLRVAAQPNDIAIAYYQLAYVLWKLGESRVGAACYLKSMMASPVVALQAMAELKGLADEYNIEPIEQDQVDDHLRAAHIVLAPTPGVLELFDTGASAAVDAGLFPVAQTLLSLRLHYQADDALVNVLRSLEAPSV